MILAFLFVGTVFAANWLLATFHLVPVGFGLVAPAGVYAAGLAFTFRDLLHDAKGRAWVVGAIVVGAIASWGISAQFAVASGAAFLLSELADLAVYAPLRRRGFVVAVIASNLVGLVVDSAAFLLIAFGSLAYLPGQIVGKLWMTALAVLLLAAVRRRWETA